VAQFVEAPRYKSADRGFDPRCGHRALSLGSTQPLTEIISRNLPLAGGGGEGGRVKAACAKG
jgi:hypothetical protein